MLSVSLLGWFLGWHPSRRSGTGQERSRKSKGISRVPKIFQPPVSKIRKQAFFFFFFFESMKSLEMFGPAGSNLEKQVGVFFKGFLFILNSTDVILTKTQWIHERVGSTSGNSVQREEVRQNQYESTRRKQLRPRPGSVDTQIIPCSRPIVGNFGCTRRSDIFSLFRKQRETLCNEWYSKTKEDQHVKLSNKAFAIKSSMSGIELDGNSIAQRESGRQNQSESTKHIRGNFQHHFPCFEREVLNSQKIMIFHIFFGVFPVYFTYSSPGRTASGRNKLNSDQSSNSTPSGRYCYSCFFCQKRCRRKQVLLAIIINWSDESHRQIWFPKRIESTVRASKLVSKTKNTRWRPAFQNE